MPEVERSALCLIDTWAQRLRTVAHRSLHHKASLSSYEPSSIATAKFATDTLLAIRPAAGTQPCPLGPASVAICRICLCVSLVSVALFCSRSGRRNQHPFDSRWAMPPTLTGKAPDLSDVLAEDVPAPPLAGRLPLRASQ